LFDFVHGNAAEREETREHADRISAEIQEEKGKQRAKISRKIYEWRMGIKK
jgi:hypothetical protein